MFIPVPGSQILIFTHSGSRILDPGSKNSNKWEGWEKICCHTFFCCNKFHKIVNYFIFETLKKKVWANFQRIIELFTQKLSLSSQKYGSGIRDTEKTYYGSRIQGSKRHQTPDPDPQHWFVVGTLSCWLLVFVHQSDRYMRLSTIAAMYWIQQVHFSIKSSLNKDIEQSYICLQYQRYQKQSKIKTSNKAHICIIKRCFVNKAGMSFFGSHRVVGTFSP